MYFIVKSLLINPLISSREAIIIDIEEEISEFFPDTTNVSILKVCPQIKKMNALLHILYLTLIIFSVAS